jgi:hypothetical protein
VDQRFVVELKVVHGNYPVESVILKGLTQLAEYADKCKSDESHVIVVDERKGKSWDERIFCQEREHNGRAITVWGM